jgi:asparagine synthase (glutamine-hydrolysing)
MSQKTYLRSLRDLLLKTAFLRFWSGVRRSAPRVPLLRLSVMCGICGIVSLAGRPVDRDLLERMNATLRHRGPDSGGLHIAEGAGLAARRLSIIDLAGGDQPIGNEDESIWVVQNGEIYNYPELRQEVLARGHTLRTRCDTEIHLHLYEDLGPRYVERLRGMFAVAIWDTRERRLVLARDRYGIKPLYYRVGGGELSFGSELKALLEQPGFSRALDLDALEAYLDASYVPAPLTIFRDAKKLPQGHLLTWRTGDQEVTIERYARPAPVAREALRGEGEDELAEELRERLADSVRAHLLSDVPVGILLSGGVDSSALTALTAYASSDPVHTFSIGFEEQSYNELDKARRVAARYGTQHHDLTLRADVVDLFPKVVESFDEPFADDSAIPTYLVSQLAASTVKVALSGEGGDELFGGYYIYAANAIAPRIGWAARLARPLVELLPTSTRSLSLEQKLKRFAAAAHLPPLERHRTWKQIFSDEARAELLADGMRGTLAPIDHYRARWDETADAEALARVLDLDFGTYMVDQLLVKTDRASMAHSLETRVPFLDPAVTDFAFALPARHKVRGFDKKRLLRKALEPLVAPDILSARKQGFSLPVASWLRGELEPYAREVLSPAATARRGIFRPDVPTQLLDDHVSGRRNNWKQLWTLLAFSVWYDQALG